jgi:NAD(P)-dependent dehydrogenase (short-subunit alcohol dehydrogenase family)
MQQHPKNDLTPCAVIIGVGGIAGIGGATALHCARQGLPVFVVGRTPSKLDALVSALQKQGARAYSHACNLGDGASIDALFNAIEASGHVPEFVLYNAAYLNMPRRFLNTPTQFLEGNWRVTALAGILSAQAAARRMLHKRHGSIIVTGASASMRGKPLFAAFASAKAALRSFTAALAHEVAPHGIHVAHVVIDGWSREIERKKHFWALGAFSRGCSNATAAWTLQTWPPRIGTFTPSHKAAGHTKSTCAPTRSPSDMSTAHHTQGGMALLFSTADHLALSRILQRQASARGIDFKWHDANTSDPEAILASLSTQGRHVSLVIFAGGDWQAGSALHTPASAWQKAWESQCLSGARVGQAAIKHMLALQQGTLIYLGHESGNTDSQPVRQTPAASFSASHAAASAGLRSLDSWRNATRSIPSTRQTPFSAHK